jgi:hypothetical protein
MIQSRLADSIGARLDAMAELLTPAGTSGVVHLTATTAYDLAAYVQHLEEERAEQTQRLAAGRVQVCAWCEREGKVTILGSPERSHGICVPHREAEIEKHQQARAEQEGG